MNHPQNLNSNKSLSCALIPIVVEMARLTIVQALPALLAIVQTASSTPLTFSTLYPRNDSQIVWPTEVSSLVHDKTWAGFGEKTTRWSSYKAPTFDEVFLPETEEQLSLAVS